MKKRIYSAEYKRYNANNRGKNSTDCVNRAISLAFNIDYNEVHKLLLNKMHQFKYQSWKVYPVYESVILDLKGGTIKGVVDDITVSEFIDKYYPVGTYILETNHMPKGKHHGNHLTCVIDGVLYDSWDSSKEFVCSYYPISTERTTRQFTHIEEHFDELREYAYDILSNEVDKQSAKYFKGLTRVLSTDHYDDLPGKVDGLSIKLPCMYEIDAFEKTHKFKFTVSYVFNPSTTIEEAKKLIDKITKIRIYDRFYEMKKKLDNYEEEYNARKQMEKTNEQSAPEFRLALDRREQQFYNSLPGKIKARVSYFCIDSYRKYDLAFSPLPGDHNSDKVRLEAYNADDLRKMIKWYIEDFSRPYQDYDPREEIDSY